MENTAADHPESEGGSSQAPSNILTKMPLEIDLSGQTALVTGAGRGIGKSIALQLGSGGARVVVHFGTSEGPAREIAEQIGNGSFAIRADLASADACLSLFDDVVEKVGRVDVLVNNAGIALSAPLDSSPGQWIEAWDDQMAVNARSAGILSYQAVRHFIEHGGGRIIHISSRAAFRGDTGDSWGYAASKSALLGLNGTIARAYGKQGVKSFVIAPGWTLTEMAQAFIEEHGDEQVLGEISLGKLTRPEDIAPMVALLASGLADHATGTSIDFNAGSYVH
jgi:NAD(P)-dependent dehydrogenase (short-subunit alcohol dehydrogenase family)